MHGSQGMVVRAMTDIALEALSSRFDEMYARPGRPSIPPEHHFTVDGTLLEAWASQKSFRRKDGSNDGGEVGLRGQRRCNETHRSATGPEAKLYRKSSGQECMVRRPIASEKEEAGIGLRKCIRPLGGARRLLAKMECAALGTHLATQSWETSSYSGF